MARQPPSKPIYFSGAGSAGSVSAPLPSLSDHYQPLNTMDRSARRQVFGLWLGMYLNDADNYEFRQGVSAEDDPLLVLKFTQDYEAGGWQRLDRGLTLQETALLLECSQGQGYMALINSEGPSLPAPRVRRKLLLGAKSILDLVTIHYTLKGRTSRRPLSTMYYDGEIGHCIAIMDAHPEGAQFAYHDPWPGRSLLCNENNHAGIAAESLGVTNLRFPDRSVEVPVWGISGADLAKIVVAVFVPLGEDWAGLLFSMGTNVFSPRLRKEFKAALIAQADEQEKNQK
jgi:hypothetical protein